MAAFTVTSSQLRSQASTLRENNSQLKSKLGNLDEQQQSLSSMWEGQAKDAFVSAFTKDRAQMDNFYNLIEQYCVALENIASKYDQAESANVSTATQRTY